MKTSKSYRWSPYNVIRENLFHPVERRPRPFFDRTIILDDYLDKRQWFTVGQAIGKGGGVSLTDLIGFVPNAPPVPPTYQLKTFQRSTGQGELPRQEEFDERFLAATPYVPSQRTPFSPEFIRRFQTPDSGYTTTEPLSSPGSAYSTPKKVEKVKGEGPSVYREEFVTPTPLRDSPFAKSSLAEQYPATKFKDYTKAAVAYDKIKKEANEWNELSKRLEDELIKRGFRREAKSLSDTRRETAEHIGNTSDPSNVHEAQQAYDRARFNVVRLENKSRKFLKKIKGKGKHRK